MPRVSVLLTCFNHIRWLPEALEGVRSQTVRDFEIIAIDDGSTDGTREWLKEQSDIRCIFNESNLGTYATLNVGLQEAKGDFIAILNDDDVWLPRKLERQLELLQAYPRVGLVHTGGHFIDENGKEVHGQPMGFAFPRFATGDVLLGMVFENKIIASAALVRRECFDKVGNFDDNYFGLGDWQMWYRIAEEYDLGFVDENLTLYRIHGSNASWKSDRMDKDGVRLREWMATRMDKLRGRFPDDEVRRAEAVNLAALGVNKALLGDAKGGREALSAAIKLEPKRWKSYLRLASTFLPKPIFSKSVNR